MILLLKTFTAILLMASVPCLAAAANPRAADDFGRLFHLRSTDDLKAVVRWADALIEESERQQAQLKLDRERLSAAKAVRDMTLEELKTFYAETNALGGKERRGLTAIRDLAGKAMELPVSERKPLTQAIIEIADAIGNNRRAPMPGALELSFAPFILCEYMHRPVGCGRTPASNLPCSEADERGTIDPLPSTFWRRPESIQAQDLYAGFGRARRPRWETNLWSYAGPKTSFGTSPGFEAVANEVRVKIKFRETISEPFTARIFAALGYFVDPTDHAESITIRYDRRLLKEFHLRKDAHTQLYRFGIPVMRIEYQRRHDPFDFIVAAVLKNRQRLSGQELKRALFFDSGKPHPEDDPGNFRENFERTIENLVTVPANVQPDNSEVKSIGPWDFNRLNHADRRELRGACLLAAWLGWCDARFDNTRLKIARVNGELELRHYFSDLGGGLGKGTGFIGRRTESPEDMEWRVTRPAEFQGRLEILRPFRIINYTPVEDNAAFEAMTIDDARWMARLISQLTRKQIIDALAACDLDADSLRLYTEKLASRRDRMIRDLKLDAPLMDASSPQRAHR
jgi:hypothetical protein